MANCEELSVFIASETEITGTFPAPFFCGPVAQSANDASANVPNASQVTFLFWPIASRYRCLKHGIPIFLVRSLLHPSFADQSANDASANVPNDSQVTSLFWPIARRNRCLLHRIPKFRVRSFPLPSFADSPLTILREYSAGDIKVFKNTRKLNWLDLETTKCTGKSITLPFFSSTTSLGDVSLSNYLSCNRNPLRCL